MAEVAGEGAGLQLTAGRHAKFLQRTLHVLPSSHANFDTQRVTISYFAIAGLDLLDKLELVAEQRREVVEWLHLRLLPSSLPSHPHDHGHVAMTYTALATLIILGDDLSGINRRALVAGVRALQLPDGSFRAALEGGENDMRFLYCAAAVCRMLDDWSGVDVEAAVSYVLASISYDGGIGQGPGLEAHGGSTYCAVAALSMMGRLGALGEARTAALTRWCLARQGREGRAAGGGEGWQGRPNKPEDTCYTFWLGGTLALLGRLELCRPDLAREFVLSTQDPVTGGLAKWTDTVPDPLHTYLGLAGLAVAGEAALQHVEPALNLSARAVARLEELHRAWREQ